MLDPYLESSKGNLQESSVQSCAVPASTPAKIRTPGTGPTRVGPGRGATSGSHEPPGTRLGASHHHRVTYYAKSHSYSRGLPNARNRVMCLQCTLATVSVRCFTEATACIVQETLHVGLNDASRVLRNAD